MLNLIALAEMLPSFAPHIAIGAGCIVSIKTLLDRGISDEKKFEKIIEACCKQKDFEMDNVPKIIRQCQKEYGKELIVQLPFGTSYEKFEKLAPVLSKNLCCRIEMNDIENTPNVQLKMLTKGFKDTDFEPVKTKLGELFFGYDYSCSPIKVNVLKHPHVLIAGTTGSGKSRMLFISLTNLIHNHSADQVNIYICSIAKRDLDKFRDCQQVKGYAADVPTVMRLFARIGNLIKERDIALSKSKCESVEDYNTTHKIKIPLAIIAIDELSFYMPDGSDSKEEKAEKEECLAFIKKLAKQGRSYGFILLMGLQCTTWDEMPLIIRRQSNVKISFAQSEDIASQVILGNKHAIGLKMQEAIIKITDAEYAIKTPNITNDMIDKYISDSKQTDEVIEDIKVNITCRPVPPGYKPQAKNVSVEDISNYGKLPRGRKKGVLNDVDTK